MNTLPEHWCETSKRRLGSRPEHSAQTSAEAIAWADRNIQTTETEK